MKSDPRWSTHEAWLADFLEPLDADVAATALAVCFSDEEPTWIVDARRERAREPHDPLTELAVTVAEIAPEAAVIATPVRMRDTTNGDLVARVWALTTVVRRRGGVDLRVRTLPVGGAGAASDLDVEDSPVASVLDDALRHPLGVGSVHALYAAAGWGHELYAVAADGGHARADADDQAALPARPRDADATRAAEAARHRLARHARDLAARHRPTDGWQQGRRRPAVHSDTPDGWQAACPV